MCIWLEKKTQLVIYNTNKESFLFENVIRCIVKMKMHEFNSVLTLFSETGSPSTRILVRIFTILLILYCDVESKFVIVKPPRTVNNFSTCKISNGKNKRLVLKFNSLHSYDIFFSFQQKYTTHGGEFELDL